MAQQTICPTSWKAPKILCGNYRPEGDINTMIPGWLKSVFDGKLINIINAISVYADVKSSSANAILKMATPAALTPVAQYAKENNMGAADIDTFLHSQKSSIIAAVPAGFNLTGSLGINSLDDIGTKIVTTQPKPSEYQQRNAVKNAAGKWIWPLLLLLTFGGLIWFFSNRDTGGPDTTNTSRRYHNRPGQNDSGRHFIPYTNPGQDWIQ